jgi:hypothetical protein
VAADWAEADDASTTIASADREKRSGFIGGGLRVEDVTAIVSALLMRGQSSPPTHP